MTTQQKTSEFSFFRDHSIEFLEMALRHDYCERIDNPDGYGKRTGDCKDTVEFFIMENNGAFTSITYDVDGCVNTNACANTVVKLASKKSVGEAWDITDQDIIDYLKTLPLQDTHCAELAIGAFYLALKDLASKKNH